MNASTQADDLNRIANWELVTPKDYTALMTYVRGLWKGRFMWAQSVGRYELHATDDDIDLIESLHDNETFWSTCWESSNRHGVHFFQTPI